MKSVDRQCVIALRDHGAMTIAQVAARTGLSRPTVDGALNSLVDEGLVRIAAETVGGGRDSGRPARLYGFHAAVGHVIGIDVGGHDVRAVLADVGGQVVTAASTELDPAAGGADAFVAVHTVLDALLADSRTTSNVVGIGIGVTGIVGPDGRVTLSYALPAWNSADIAGRLRDEYGCPVALENDARLEAMAEHHLGATTLTEHAVHVHVGRRLSISLLINGRPHRGRHSASGEAGYLLFDGIRTDEASNILWNAGETAQDVVRRSQLGDRDATAELEAFVEAIAPGIAALALVVDPDLVVIGGGLSQAGAPLIADLQRAVNERIRIPAVPTLVQARLGGEAVLVGALIRALELASVGLYGQPPVPVPALHIEPLLNQHVSEPVAAP